MADLYELSKRNTIPAQGPEAPTINGNVNIDRIPVQDPNYAGVYTDVSIRDIALSSSDPQGILENWDMAKELSSKYPAFTTSQIFNNIDTFKTDYFGKNVIPTKTAIRAIADEARAGDLINENGKLFNALANMQLGLPAVRVNLGSLLKGEDPLKMGEAEIMQQIAVNQQAIEALQYDPVDRGWLSTALKWTAAQVPQSIEAIIQAIEGGMAGTAAATVSAAVQAGRATAAGASAAGKIAQAGKGLGAFYESVGAPGAGAKTAASLAAKGEAAVQGAAGNATVARSALGMARTVGGLELTNSQVLKTIALQKALTGGTTFAQGIEVMRGLDYQQMVEDGRDPKIAAIVSLGTGVVNQALEQYLGIESGIANLVSKGSLANLSGAIMARLHTSGVLQPIAAFAARELVGTAGETSAEVLQSLTTNVGSIIARSIAEEGIHLSAQDINRMARDMGQSFVQTLVTAPLLGIGANVAMTIGDHKSAREFAKVAPTMSREAAIGYAKDKKVFGEAMPEAETENIAGQAWDEATKRKMDEESTRRDVMMAQAQTRQTEGQAAPERVESGALRIEYDDVGDGVVNATVASVNPSDETGAAATYASVSLLEDKEAKTLTIDTSEFDERYSGISDEVVGEILAKYPGWQFKLSGVPGPTIEGAFNRQVKLLGAPESSVEDNQARNRVRSWLDETGQFSPLRREAAVGMMQFLANATGQSFSKFVAPLRGIATSTDAEFNRKAWGSIQFVDGDGKILQMPDMMKRAGAIITLAENAGPVPFAHEMSHFMVPAMKEEDRSVLEAVYGITNGVWKVEHYERLSDEILSFLKEGKLSDEKLRPLFDRIAEWLRGMWRDFKSLDLDPRIRKLFEDWLERPVVKSAEEAKPEDTRREASPLEITEEEEPAPGLASAVVDEDAGEGPPAEGRKPRPVTDIYELDPADITINKNFKRGANRKGETEPIQGKLRPDHAPIIVRRTPNGPKPYEIVTGRHRLNAAIRDGVPIRAYIRPETMTETEAKLEDVEANILDDQGSVEDYAIFFRAMKEEYTYEFAKQRGLLGRSKGRQGFAIGHYASENLYSLYRDGKIDGAKAAAIAEAARGDEALEAIGIDNKALSIDEIQQHILVSKMMGGGESVNQGDLFGDDSSVQQQREEARRMVKSAVDITKGMQKRVGILNAILGMANKADRRKALSEFGGNLESLDDARIEGELSILEAKLARWKSAEWITDPQLVAEARKAAGLSYNEASFKTEVVGMAGPDDGQASLFMSKKEKDAYQDKAEQDVSQDAKDYPSAAQWAMDAYGIDLAKASDGTREWFNRTWEYHHSGKPKKYAKRGDFVKFLFVRKNLSDFLYAIDRAVNPRNPDALSDVEARRSRRIKDLISKTPVLVKAVETLRSERRMPNQKETKNLEIYVRRNEALVKFLYAEVSGDTDLGFEAMSEIPYMAEIDKKSFVAAPGRTLRDMEAILKQLKDDAFREKVREGKATVAEFDRYEKRILDAMDKASDEGRKEAGQEQAANIKSAREESRMNVRLAKEAADERIAVYKIKRHMRRLHDFIMAKPSMRMDNRFRKYIELIQQYIKNGQQIDPEFMPSMASIEFAKSPASLAAMIQVVNSISSKPYGEWTLENLQDLAQVVGDLGKMGRAQYQFDKATKGYAAQAMRQQVEKALKEGRFYQPSLPGVDAEEAEEKARRRWLGLAFMRPDAAIHRLETPKEGHERVTVISDLLVRDHSRALEGKYSNTDRRVAPIQRFIFQKGINKTLYDELVVKGAGPEDTDLRITRNDLIGIRCLIGTRKEFNQKQRQAFVFGELFSEKEKQYGDDTTPAIPEERAMYGDQQHKGDNYLMRNYERKLEAILEATEKMLTDDERRLADMMVDTMDDESDWMRFAQAVIDITNREMKKEKRYFPVIRQKPLDSSDRIAEAIVASGIAPMYYESGFTLDRARNIAPHSQVGVRFDAMRMFHDAIEKQEHLINIGPYVKTVKDVFQNSHHSHGITEMIRSSMGREGLDYVTQLIDTITNPNAFKRTRDGGELISALQGRKYTAYLAYRWSSVLMQMGTSPLPFISEAPAELLALVPEYLASVPEGTKTIGSGEWTNPFIEAIEEKSGELRNRQMDPREAEILRLMEGPLGKISNFGMRGLVWADRTSVALGWEAVYRRKFQEYGKAGSDPAAARQKAIEYANEVVRKTQVTNEPAFRAPAYRNMDGWKQQVLMFTAPLNVIWNNLAYDVPAEVKEREFGKAVGLVAAYALSGLVIGATKVARGAVNGPKDDADDEERARFWTWYWLTAGASQFTESIPLIGKYISAGIATVTTGRPMIFNNNSLPMAETFTTALAVAMQAFKAGELDASKAARIADSMLEGLALFFGLPYLGVKELPGVKELSAEAVERIWGE